MLHLKRRLPRPHRIHMTQRLLNRFYLGREHLLILQVLDDHGLFDIFREGQPTRQKTLTLDSCKRAFRLGDGQAGYLVPVDVKTAAWSLLANDLLLCAFNHLTTHWCVLVRLQLFYRVRGCHFPHTRF